MDPASPISPSFLTIFNADLIIFSGTEDDHKREMRHVLEMLRAHDLRCDFANSTLEVDSTDRLGLQFIPNKNGRKYMIALPGIPFVWQG
jgi:hypothetical protein